MTESKTIAFFPEAAFGPALNSVGIAQACTQLGHRAVFLTDPGMAGVYEGYGFKEYPVNMSEPMPPEEMAKYWSDFINGHVPNFNKSPYERNSLDTCVGYYQDGDAVLLIEDGVYAAIKSGTAASKLDGVDVSVLGSDLAARRVSEDKLVDGVKIVDYAGFVDLVEAKDKVQSWL